MDLFFYIVLFLLALWLTTVTHELSHCLVAKIAKWKIKRICVLPEKVDEKWVLGFVEYETHNKNTKYIPYMNSVPLWKSFILMHFYLSLCVVWFPFIIFALVELSDYISWWIGYVTKDERTDGGKTRILEKMNS